jgi:hypothetical protein
MDDADDGKRCIYVAPSSLLIANHPQPYQCGAYTGAVS